MLIISPKTLYGYNEKVEAFKLLFGIEPQVRIAGTLIELLTGNRLGDIVFLKNKATIVLDAKELYGELYFHINVDGELVWVQKHLDDFEIDFYLRGLC